MQRQKSDADFVLFPPHSLGSSSEMLALESARSQNFPFFAQQQMPLDAAVMDSFGYPAMQQGLDALAHNPDPVSFYDPSLFHGVPAPSTPPSMAASHYSAASGPSIASASSSAIGSPYSGAAHSLQESWIDTSNGLGLPMNELDYNRITGAFETEATFAPGKFSDNFVDPSLIQPIPQQHSLPTTMSYAEDPQLSLAHSSGFMSPAHVASPLPHHSMHLQQSQMQVASPFMGGPSHPTGAPYERRRSFSSSHSPRSHQSPTISNADGDDEGREKSRCPFPDCGRSFKDLKAHMLTHQSERPEKCPIVTCEYHLKGFARKYDKNRHTLTHYKGTMVCGFCPGSGSAAEKSFNRADVFKRHLMSVHGVEQTPPNCRKRSPTATSGSKKLVGYSEDATGKCSTCSATFSNAQDFYEHLDDCVLRVVQQEEPSEAINQKRLAEVAADEEVKKTMEKHQLLDAATPVGGADQIDEYHDDDDDEDNESNDSRKVDGRSGKGSLKPTRSGAHSSSRCVLGTNSAVNKGGKTRPVATRRRGNRNNYPQSWGTPASKMKTKKRVLCIYDGKRRLWKDEMVLDNEFEVRLGLPGGAGDGTNRDAYVTDLDIECVKRAEGVFSATEEERGPWMGESSNRLMGQPAMLLPEISQMDGIDIDELMA